MKLGTKLIHAGVEADPSTGAIMTPIYQTSTYVQEEPGKLRRGYEYSRTSNPTRAALESALAAVENGKHGLCFGSGMAASDTVAKLLQPGDEIVATNDLYGGSYRLFTTVWKGYGIASKFVDMTDANNVLAAVNSKTKMIWIETPTNPMVGIIDIQAICNGVKGKDIIVVVDNTFASPYLQTPLDLGADIVLHSATKYLGGHSDVVLGALVTGCDSLAEKLYTLQNTCGAVCGPMDSFLVLRGLKTLHIRMDRHSHNGELIAKFLKNHPKVDNVYWPGFESHPNHAIAKKQMRGFGGMVSFSLKGNSKADAHTVLSNTEIFACAESLGGVESLIGHPATMTHAAIPKEEREKSGVVESLIRLSIGIEDADDLIADLSSALEKI